MSHICNFISDAFSLNTLKYNFCFKKTSHFLTLSQPNMGNTSAKYRSSPKEKHKTPIMSAEEMATAMLTTCDNLNDVIRKRKKLNQTTIAQAKELPEVKAACADALKHVVICADRGSPGMDFKTPFADDPTKTAALCAMLKERNFMVYYFDQQINVYWWAPDKPGQQKHWQHDWQAATPK